MDKSVGRYDVKDERGRWLGTFLITADGLLTCRTDFGSYSYWWTSTGREDFREFLTEIDADYLLRKVAPVREYDAEATERAIREHIASARKDEEIDDATMTAWIESVDNAPYGLSDVEGFAAWVHEHGKLEPRIDGAHELAVHRHPRDAAAFAERVWPPFVRMLREEIEAERATASAKV
jgi:hypothetical protein